MTRSDRVAELLAGVPWEERLRGRTVEEAAKILGFSEATVYRLHSEGKLGGVKGDGAERTGGKGRSGALRIRLLDIAEYQVAHEVGVTATPTIPRGRARVAADVRRAGEAS